MSLAPRSHGRAELDDAQALFDHVDGHRLHHGEFRASGSMAFHDRPELDFADTLPAWSASSRAAASPAMR